MTDTPARTTRVLSWIILCVALGMPRPGHPQSVMVQWDAAERVIAFGDVHGAASELRTLLRDTGVISADDHWIAGTTHLVSLGDLLDRGIDARSVLDLLMRLQVEATAAGGRVHVLLGNHEAMSLMGDLRYVDAREYASWSDLELPAIREQERLAWNRQTCTTPCPAFDVKYPPGYFGRRAALSPAGKYGQWLLAQPVAIRIGDTLFMHGGPAGLLRGMTLAEVNLRYRTSLTDVLHNPEAERELAMLSDLGPNWYRGTALCNEASEADILRPMLQQFGASRIVIGHTPTRDSRVVSRFDGQVIRLDTGMNRAAFRGQPAALVIDRSGTRVRYAGQGDYAQVEPEALHVLPNGRSDAEVMNILRSGAVKVIQPLAADEHVVTVRLDGQEIPAIFRTGSADAIRKENAALQLDRLLHLGIVPATVERDIEGRPGLLQARPRNGATQAQVRGNSLQVSGSCAALPQFQLLYALDTLLGNEGRTSESLLWDLDTGTVYATDFARALGNGRGLPRFLQKHLPLLGAEMRRRLSALDEAQLSRIWGTTIDTRALRAVLARRDALLALPAAASAP